MLTATSCASLTACACVLCLGKCLEVDLVGRCMAPMPIISWLLLLLSSHRSACLCPASPPIPSAVRQAAAGGSEGVHQVALGRRHHPQQGQQLHPLRGAERGHLHLHLAALLQHVWGVGQPGGHLHCQQHEHLYRGPAVCGEGDHGTLPEQSGGGLWLHALGSGESDLCLGTR